MPHKINTSICSKFDKLAAIAIFAIMVLSGSLCILLQEVPSNRNESITGLSVDEGVPNIQGEIPPAKSILSEKTRGDEEEYMNLVWEKGHGEWIGGQDSLVSADVDNDGIVEIIFGNSEGFIHVIQYSNGEYIDEWKSPNLGSQTYGLTTGDVDNDGTIEIIIGTYDYIFYIFGYENEEIGFIEEWSYSLSETSLYGIATGDIDNDGTLEIIVGTNANSDSDSNVNVFGFDGTTYILEWSTFVGSDYINSVDIIAIGDVDNDGTNEFIVGLNELILGSYRGSSFIYGYNGGTYILEWSIEDPNNEIRDIDVGDVDDDGILEIVLGAGNVSIYQYQSGIYILENEIQELEAFVEIGDVNSDGINEIVTATDILKIWQEDNLLWESINYAPEDIHGMVIKNSDNDQINEIIISIGETFKTSDLLVIGMGGTTYKEEWRGDYLDSVAGISINDIDRDSYDEIILGMVSGEVIILEFKDGDYLIEGTIQLPNSGDIFYIFSDDFDNDDTLEIAVISAIFSEIDVTMEICYIEYISGNYVISDQLEIGNGYSFAVDVGDVDNDNIKEIVIGTWIGNVIVIGFNGDSYSVEWQDQIMNNMITGVAIGDSDGDEDIEIVIGGSIGEPEETLYVLGFDAGDYIIEWSTFTDGGVWAADIGDPDNDGINEIVVEEAYSNQIIIFEWDGTTYSEEWRSAEVDLLFDSCFDINDIEQTGESEIIYGGDDLFVLKYDSSYQYIWHTENLSNFIRCIFIGNSDNLGANEITVSLGGYILIYSRNQKPAAVLSTSQTTVFIGEEIEFNGSLSKGISPLEYHFDFGDGENSGWIIEPSTIHSYSNVGIYLASLIVRDSNGVESEIPANITISVIKPNQAPTAFIDSISPNSAFEGEIIYFSGHGYDEDGNITSYYWESDIDGKLSTLQSFNISSLSIGNHIISFKVQDDDNSWSDWINRSLKIKPIPQNEPPSAIIDSITPNPAIEGETIFFEGFGDDNDGTIVSYSWESNIDGLLSDKSSFTSSSLSVGTHSISFTVQDNDGEWSDIETTSLTIEPIPPNQAPTAYIDSVSPNPAIEGEIIIFEGSGDDSDGAITSYSWESNIDGILSSERTFSTSSLTVGEHTITFKVEDDNGLWSESEMMTLVVKEKEDDEGGTSSVFGDLDNERLIYLIFVFAIFCFLIIVVIAIVSGKNKKMNSDTYPVTCPGCGDIFDVASPIRPLTVNCPNCGLGGVLKLD